MWFDFFQNLIHILALILLWIVCWMAMLVRQNINIMSRALEQCPAKLKVTLNNFRSYCQKTYISSIPISQFHNNASITKYRSYRQMKMLNNKSEFTPTFASKKHTHLSPSKKEQLPLNFKQSELIDLIKHKLRQKTSFDHRLKTEVNQKEDVLNIRSNKKNPDPVTNFVHSTKIVKTIKRKKIDLTVTNSKVGLFAREERPTISKQIVIAIKERPCSAIEYRTNYPTKQYETRLPSKHSAHYPHGQKLKTQQNPLEQHENQRCREISGWEFQNHEETFLQEDEQPRKRKNKRKKKGDSKNKSKS